MKVLPPLLLAIVSIESFAQFQITFAPTLPNELHYTQLWQFDIVSNNSTTQTVRITGTLEDQYGIALRATSATVELVPGHNSSTYLQERLKPTTSFVKPEYARALNSLSGFPSGEYQWCIEIEEVAEQYIGGQACITKVVSVLIPPHLITPEHEAIIQESRPVFAWSPPVPVKNHSALNYTIKIVEQKKGQLPEAAIATNSIHFQLTNLRSPILSYPATAKSFEVGKKYAWTVVAYIGGQAIPAEEVWLFQPEEEPQPAVIQTTGSYAKLKSELDVDFVTLPRDGHLRFAFNSQQAGATISFQIENAHRKGCLQEKLAELKKVKLGYNQYDIDLSCAIRETGYYTLTINWPNGSTRYLRFYYSTDAAYHESCNPDRSPTTYTRSK